MAQGEDYSREEITSNPLIELFFFESFFLLANRFPLPILRYPALTFWHPVVSTTFSALTLFLIASLTRKVQP